MNDEDREELLWRRIADKITEGADNQIKRRYFWAAILFAGITWIGFASIITSYVQSEVRKNMDPAQKDFVRAQLMADQAKSLADQLKKSLDEASKSAAKLRGEFNEINKNVNLAVEKESTLERQLNDVASVTSQYNKSIGLLKTAVADLSKTSPSKESAQTIDKLAEQQIIVRISGDPSPNVSKQRLIDEIASKLGGTSFIGTSTLRYFYMATSKSPI